MNESSGHSDHAVHIVHVVPTLDAGGMELMLARVVHALSGADMRHSVVVLKGGIGIGRSLPPGVQVYCMNARSNELLLALRLYHLFRQIRPTVVHARNWGAWPEVALASLGAHPRIPVIFSFHGFDTAARIPWRRRLAFRVLGCLTRKIFAVSKASRMMLLTECRLGPAKIAVIPNGIDFTPSVPGDRRAKETGPLVVGSVGNLTPVKNQALLIRACAQAAAEGLDLQVHLAGEGLERPNLENLARTLGVPDRVVLHGYVQDVPRFLHGLDLFVLCSDSEAHPNALLEAMACGLPCIATDVGGMPETLDYGRVGRLVAAGDSRALARAIIDMGRDSALRQSLGAAAQEWVSEHYSFDHMAKRYRHLYLAVAARSKSSTRRYVYRVLTRTGLPRIARMICAQHTVIVCYHGVIPDYQSRGWMTRDFVPESLFLAHLEVFRRHFNVVPLRMVADAVALSARHLPPRSVAITFDDGFKNNLRYALPALKHYGIAATFFVTTGFVDRSVEMWWLKLKAIVVQALRCGASLRVPGILERTAIASSKQAEGVYQKLLQELKIPKSGQRSQIIQALQDYIGDGGDSFDDVYEPLNWADVRQLRDAGMEVGAHSVTHPILSREDCDRARQEVLESVAQIRQKLSIGAIPFSYPNGQEEDFNRAIKEYVREAGCYCGLANFPGRVGPGSDLFALRRFSIGGLHSIDSLELELSGMAALARKALALGRRVVSRSRRGWNETC